MQMSITMPDLSDAKLKEFSDSVNKIARVKVFRQKGSIIIECNDNMPTCQKVISVSDTFWGGENSVKKEATV